MKASHSRNIANRVMALCDGEHDAGDCCYLCARKIARLAANEAYERAAKACEADPEELAVHVAAAIRAMKEGT